jgi:hypothetical protein
MCTDGQIAWPFTGHQRGIVGRAGQQHAIFLKSQNARNARI